MLKPFSGKKNCPVEMGPKMAVFGENGKIVFETLSFVSLPCAESRRLTYFVPKSVRASRL